VLATNTHHRLLSALVDSYAAVPVGLGATRRVARRTASARMLGMVFVIGVRIAAPLVVVLLVVELALGLAGRVAPALNVMMSGAPVRLAIGLFVAPPRCEMSRPSSNATFRWPSRWRLTPSGASGSRAMAGQSPTGAIGQRNRRRSRKRDARASVGQVARSRDLASAVSLVAVTLALGWLGARMVGLVSTRIAASFTHLATDAHATITSTTLSGTLWVGPWVCWPRVAGPPAVIAASSRLRPVWPRPGGRFRPRRCASTGDD
jgi:hypothetical protein